MTKFQKVIKRFAIAFAIFLSVAIICALLGLVGFFGNLFENEAVLEDLASYSVTAEIHNLKIEINAADLQIKEGEKFFVESNLKHLKVEEKGNTLLIKENRKIFGTYRGAVLTVYVPAGMVFNSIELTTGAGRLTTERLSAGTVDFEFGAGDVNIASLAATRAADIEGGAGRITILGGTLNNLELEMGVGQLNLTSALTGDCKLDLGIGESNIALIGDKDDYRLDLNKGIGSITVDGESTNHYSSSGNGTNKVEINGGIGAIYVLFKEEITA